MTTKLAKRPGARRIRVIGANPRKMGVRRAARPLPSVADFRSRYGARSIEVAARLRSKSRTQEAFNHWSRVIAALEKRKPNPRKTAAKRAKPKRAKNPVHFHVAMNGSRIASFVSQPRAVQYARALHARSPKSRITVYK